MLSTSGRYVGGIGAVFAAGLIAGCSGAKTPKLATVTGVVLLDGQPLDEVEIILIPESTQGEPGPRANGFSNREGRFQPQTTIEGVVHDAVLVGTHRVMVRDLKRLTAQPPDPKQEYASETGRRPAKSRVPSSLFNDAQASPTPTVVIGEGVHELVLELDSKGKASLAKVKPAASAR